MGTGKGLALPGMQNVGATEGTLRKKYCTDFYHPSNTANIFPYGHKERSSIIFTWITWVCRHKLDCK